MNISTASGIISFLRSESYLFMFILLIFEGPVVTYAASFLASVGLFNVYIVFALSLLGNLVGDMGVYLLGRFWGKNAIRGFIKKFVKNSTIKKMEKAMKENSGKAIAFVKLTPPLPVPGILLMGSMGVPIKTFFAYSSSISLAYSLFFTLLGFYSGVAFSSIFPYVKYSEIIIGTVIILAIVIWFLTKFISGLISRKIGDM